MERFECELRALISSANFRKQIHGETKIAAVDLRVELHTDLAQTTDILEQLLHDAAMARNLLGLIDSGEFPKPGPFAADYEDHRVSLRVSAESLAIFASAELNEFKVEKDGNVYTIRFRIQSLQGDVDANKLVRSIQEEVAISISPAQTELDLDDETAAA